MGSVIDIKATDYQMVDDTWEDRLRDSYTDMCTTAAPAIIDFAKEVAAFKSDCQAKQGGSEFTEKVQDWLGMSAETCKMWAIVGERSNSLAVPTTSLPPSMDTIYRLTTLPKEVIKRASDEGKIHPEMTRSDVQALKPAKEVSSKKEVSGIDLFRRNVRKIMRLIDDASEKEQRHIYSQLEERFNAKAKAS